MIPHTEEARGVLAVRLYEPGECHSIVERAEALGAWAVAQVRVREEGGRHHNLTNPASRTAGVLSSPSARTLYGDFDAKLDAIVKPLIKQFWGVSLGEHHGTQLIRYGPGGHYAAHADAGGDLVNRYFSVVCYLNEDFEGGHTSFPWLGYSAAPRRGSAIVFPSAYVHRACPVVSGEKFVLVSWVLGPVPVRWI
jgi:hypothetical protein